MSIFWSLLGLTLWIGFWFWFLTRKDSSSMPLGHGSPSVDIGRGLFIRKVKPDENQDLADWAQ